jgi:hypothetical protein
MTGGMDVSVIPNVAVSKILFLPGQPKEVIEACEGIVSSNIMILYKRKDLTETSEIDLIQIECHDGSVHRLDEEFHINTMDSLLTDFSVISYRYCDPETPETNINPFLDAITLVEGKNSLRCTTPNGSLLIACTETSLLEIEVKFIPDSVTCQNILKYSTVMYKLRHWLPQHQSIDGRATIPLRPEKRQKIVSAVISPETEDPRDLEFDKISMVRLNSDNLVDGVYLVSSNIRILYSHEVDNLGKLHLNLKTIECHDGSIKYFPKDLQLPDTIETRNKFKSMAKNV